MVPAAGPVLIEIGWPHLMRLQIRTGRRRCLDGASRRNMIRGDGVEEQAKNARINDVANRLRLHRDAFEIRWILHVGRGHVPLVSPVSRNIDGLPVGVAGKYICVSGPVEITGDIGLNQSLDFLVARPDIPKKNRLAVMIMAQRFRRHIDQDRSGQRIGDNQRRRRQVVCAYIRVDAAFEVAVSRQHGDRHEFAFVDCAGNIRWQRPRIANACSATEPDEIEAERIERFLQTGIGEISGNRLRSWRQ